MKIILSKHFFEFYNEKVKEGFNIHKKKGRITKVIARGKKTIVWKWEKVEKRRRLVQRFPT
jgi:hypothetical protein